MHSFRVLAVFLLGTGFCSALPPTTYSRNGEDINQRLRRDLGPKLSPGSSITLEGPARWSEYSPPKSKVVVNVKKETDVAATVSFCAANNVTFVAQNGGSGWAAFDQNKDAVLINLAGLNSVTVSSDKRSATIGGGASVKDTIAAADAAGVLVQTGNCNCVGTLGALLGGGYGNLMGMHGLGVDNIISLQAVTPDGRLRTVRADRDKDLFWALRGAGPNFGIVTSAVVKAYPTEKRTAWTGGLIFTGDKLEQVVQAIDKLDLKPEMNVFLYFISSGPPTNAPAILVTPYLFQGDASAGQAAFKSLYDIGPVQDGTAVLPYTQWNTGADGFCTRGERKPSYSAGLNSLNPKTWREVWDLYVKFQQKPGAQNTVVLCEVYSMNKARSIPTSSSAFPHRDVDHFAVVIPWYNDTALDTEALAFGGAVRDLWRSTNEAPGSPTYVNFGHGDETLNQIYGNGLSRLRQLKKVYDPNNLLNQWFPIR